MTGNRKVDIDAEALMDLALRGFNKKEQADILGVETRDVSEKIDELSGDKKVLETYRTLQSLELTSLQSEILENITPDKIQKASLRDLVAAFKILKDKELAIEGKPSEIRGLVGYLVEMEKRELAEKNEVIEGKFEIVKVEEPVVIKVPVKDIADEEYLPNL